MSQLQLNQYASPVVLTSAIVGRMSTNPYLTLTGRPGFLRIPVGVHVRKLRGAYTLGSGAAMQFRLGNPAVSPVLVELDLAEFLSSAEEKTAIAYGPGARGGLYGGAVVDERGVGLALYASILGGNVSGSGGNVELTPIFDEWPLIMPDYVAGRFRGRGNPEAVAGQGLTMAPAPVVGRAFDPTTGAQTFNPAGEVAPITNIGTLNLTEAQSGALITNEGASGSTTVNLPNNPTRRGIRYSVAVDAVQQIAVVPAAGESLYLNGELCTTNMLSAIAGAAVSVVCTRAGSGGRWTAVGSQWTRN